MSVTRFAVSDLSARHIILSILVAVGLTHSVSIYLSVLTFTSGSVRWDHRSPFDFIICIIICILFAFAAAKLLGLRHTERHAPER